MQYLERKPHQLKLVFMRVFYPGRVGIWKCWFMWRGVTRIIRKNPGSQQTENLQQTKPTYGNGPESNPGHIGESSHYSAIPAALKASLVFSFDQPFSALSSAFVVRKCFNGL